jgi:hypothetical protein
MHSSFPTPTYSKGEDIKNEGKWQATKKSL